jgi:hypothetical protein
MPFFNNKRKDFSIQPPKLQVNSIPFFVTDSANIDFTFANNNLTGDLTLTGVTAGTYGSNTQVPVLQIDQWGRITGVTLQTISTSGLALEVNGTPNGNQTLLNLVAGTNMTITDDGFGNITFDATGGGGTYTVDNGLTENPANNFQLGGSLIQSTTITASTHRLNVDGPRDGDYPFYVSNSGNTNGTFAIVGSAIGTNARGIKGTGTLTGVLGDSTTGEGVRGVSTTNAGVTGVSNTFYGIYGESTNSYGVVGYSATREGGAFSTNASGGAVQDVISLFRNTSGGSVSAGLGAGLATYLEKSLNNGAVLLASRLATIWTDPVEASRTARFDLSLVNNAVFQRVLSLTGPGQLILDKYGINTFTGTPAYALGVDATGNVVEFTPATGGGTVTSVGTTGLISGGPITTTGTITTSMNTNKLVGRGTAGVGIMEEITLGTGLSLSGTTLNATGGGGGIEYGVASGTNTYSVTISGVTSYTDGDTYVIKFTNGNDDDSSININGLGAKDLVKKVNVRVTGGDIVAGQDLIIIYDGTNFQTIGVAPNQFFAYVTNDDSVTITKGQPVYAFGAAGNRMSVKLASNTSDATSAQTVGVVFSSSIAANQRGFIITQGVIAGVNTSAYSPGDQLYLGATAGTLTATKPVAPNHLVYIGIVERANAGNGQIYIKPQNGYELDELHNVLITSPQNNQFLVYETGTPNLWKNKSLGTVLGGTTSQYVRGDGTLQTNAGSIVTILDGQGGVIQTGRGNNFLSIPFSGTITGWTVLSSVSGSIEVAFWKDTYANYPPTVADNIFSPNPSLTLTNKNQATGLSIAVAAGDIIIPNVVSVTTCTNVTISIQITRS